MAPDIFDALSLAFSGGVGLSLPDAFAASGTA